jgi:hypothetical protein
MSTTCYLSDALNVNHISVANILPLTVTTAMAHLLLLIHLASQPRLGKKGQYAASLSATSLH